MAPERDLSRVWLALSIVGIAAGGALWLAGLRDAANVVGRHHGDRRDHGGR